MLHTFGKLLKVCFLFFLYKNFLAINRDRDMTEIVVRELNFSITTLEIFRSLSSYPNFFFLDSALDKTLYSKYSFFGIEPFLTIESTGLKTVIKDEEGIHEHNGNPFDLLNELLDRYNVESLSDVHAVPEFPFSGGAVGYFSYDLCHFIEILPDTTKDDIEIPDMYFGFYDTFLAFNHTTNICYAASLDINRPCNDQYIDPDFHTIADNRIDRLIGKIAVGSKSQQKRENDVTAVNEKEKAYIASNFTKKEYVDSIGKAKEYILNGDIYQVNLSQRFQVKTNYSPFELYERLRRFNPAPYSSFISLDGFYIMSSSPERFLSAENVKKEINGTGNKLRIQTRPIKGTRPRCLNKDDDVKSRDELLLSAKDDAELTMIVDLERNDLGRVCDFGSIRVTEKKILESYSEVHHLVATIEGDMDKKHGIIDLIKATFPGGSITGAPKIRAMEIIDELEKTKRGVYTGAIGYIGFNRNVDLSIAIRTLLMKDNQIYFQAGGGIVADSNPESEYEETLHKASALMKAVGVVHE